MELAAQLGSDVPFFLLGGAAVGVGRGTELYPLPDPMRGRRRPAGGSGRACFHCRGYRALSPRLTTESQQNKIVSFQSQVGVKLGTGRCRALTTLKRCLRAVPALASLEAAAREAGRESGA